MSNRNYVVNESDLERFDFTARELMRVALSRGYAVEYSEARPDNSVSGISHCTKGENYLAFRTDNTTLSPIFAYMASENKHLSAALFDRDNVPTPDSVTVPVNIDSKELIDVVKKYGKLVVKPLTTNHGTGITVGVDSANKARDAIDFIKKIRPSDKFVMLQKQIDGAKEYRFLVLKGKVIAVAHRRPPFIIGDGRRSIRELIDELNLDERRGEGHRAVMTKVKISDVIKENGEEFLDSIPGEDEQIDVLRVSNLSRGGTAEDFTDRTSDKLKDIAMRAANSCFLGLAGVDMMTTDIENGDENNSFVIEVNSAPGLRMHMYPSIGTSRDVAGQIFDVLEGKE